ncbi:hypothetical protein [Streptomyces sp. NPDC014894]|uniref:hypothetical protein n=1 Tax=Streptomyces sp. NPDC014894 TaxID=3364931 RepID=UPI0036FA16E4
MTFTDTLTGAQADRAVEVLAHPGVIRLVTEIDDHGPVPRHMISRTFPDLPLQRVRDGSALARRHGLVRAGQQAGQPVYRLTEHGAALADVYDSVARWARAHHYPTRHSDFTSRVRATLTLLTQDTVPADATGPAQTLHRFLLVAGAARDAASQPSDPAS